jgi:integrase
LGWQRWPHEKEGRWVLRRYIGEGKYRIKELGRADDDRDADGERVLSFDQAQTAAIAESDVPQGRVTRMTVRQAMERYVEFKRGSGQPVADLLSRGWAHIVPPLGDLTVSELTAERLRRWLANLGASPAQSRPKKGKPQYRPEPKGDEAVRRRRASANRVLTMLKAALNHAYDEGHVPSRDAWGRKLAPFREVEVARIRYLSVPESTRLVNACDSEFRALLRAALETGCRYGELVRLEVADFNRDAGTVAVRRSKSGKARHVILTEEGAAFFRQHTAGRRSSELMFTHADGTGWKKSEQKRPMEAALVHARITPAITFHGLRHTWASLATMNGVPLMVVAKNLGHADTRMVERCYGHLSPSYVAEAIRAGAPRYGLMDDGNLIPLSSKR